MFLYKVFSFQELAFNLEALSTIFKLFNVLLIFVSTLKPDDFLNIIWNS
jgi:hypothetical protein